MTNFEDRLKERAKNKDDFTSDRINDLHLMFTHNFRILFFFIVLLAIVFQVQILINANVISLSSFSAGSPIKSDMFIVNSTVDNNSFYMYYEDISMLNRMFSIYKNEFAMCFEKLQDNPIVLRPSFTLQKSFNAASVLSICPVNSYLHIHSHPNNVCSFSNDDFVYFNSENYEVMGVICGNDWRDFVFVDKNNNNLTIGIIK